MLHILLIKCFLSNFADRTPFFKMIFDITRNITPRQVRYWSTHIEVIACCLTNPYKEYLIWLNFSTEITMHLHTWSYRIRWRHQMETFSALLARCARNCPVTGEFSSQRPVTRSFDVFFDLPMTKRLSKRGADDLRRYRLNYDVIVMDIPPQLTWTNRDLTSMMFCGIHLRAISWTSSQIHITIYRSCICFAPEITSFPCPITGGTPN